MVLTASADGIIVSLRTQGGQFDKEGISLFWIDPKADGVSLKAYPTVDGLRAAELTLEKVSVPSDALLGPLHGGFDILDAVAQEATLALSAEGLGAMERLYKDTVEYTQNREQFDHPLSDFQRFSTAWWKCSWSTSNASLALPGDPGVCPDGMAASKSVSACKHLVGVAGRFIGENAVQLHGGMGVMEELAIGHYFKRSSSSTRSSATPTTTSSVTQHELEQGEAPASPCTSLAEFSSPPAPRLNGALIPSPAQRPKFMPRSY